MRKMLALSEPSKTRPYQGPTPRIHAGACALSMALPMPGSGLMQHHHAPSPSPSPGINRRSAVPHQQPVTRGASHERSHSDAAMPVDLSAESSSVTSLANLAAMRKSHMSGSVTSTDSAGAGTSANGGGSASSGGMAQPLGLGLTLGIGLGVGLGADMDPGYCTQFETHSSNSSSSDVVSATSAAGHVHLISASGAATESPPVAPRTRVPLYPHGAQGNQTVLHLVVRSLSNLSSLSCRFLANQVILLS